MSNTYPMKQNLKPLFVALAVAVPLIGAAVAFSVRAADDKKPAAAAPKILH